MKIDTSKIGSIFVHSGDGEFKYDEVTRSRHASNGRLATVVKDRDPSQDLEQYSLGFDWTQSDGTLWVRGNFFSEAPDEPKKAILLSESAKQIEYAVYEPGDSDPWVIEIEVESSIDDEEDDVVITKKPVSHLSTRNAPILAKNLKDKFNDYATSVATMAPDVIDAEDGAARLYIKFLNGRKAQLEHFDEVSEEERGEIFCIHWTDHVSLKKFWTSVSAAIVFSVAFAFIFETEDGDEIELLLRRCPDDKHAADEFCEEILGCVQGELEDLLNDELKTTVENGFAHLEKLILQGNNPPPDSLVRKLEKFPKPAPKKVRRNA